MCDNSFDNSGKTWERFSHISRESLKNSKTYIFHTFHTQYLSASELLNFHRHTRVNVFNTIKRGGCLKKFFWNKYLHDDIINISMGMMRFYFFCDDWGKKVRKHRELGNTMKIRILRHAQITPEH